MDETPTVALILCRRTCWPCKFGNCKLCDGMAAEPEEIESWALGRGLLVLMGCDPGPILVECWCTHEFADCKEDESIEPLPMAPASAIVISSDLL